ncbi:hypothetical protein V8E54_013682 [Elaphomyces granulatus]
MPGICLFYSLCEFEGVINRYCSTVEFTLAKEVQDYVFSSTAGHPGVSRAILDYIDQFYRNNLKRKVKEITLNNIRDALDDDDKLFPFLASWTKSGRSFPSRVYNCWVCVFAIE